MLNKAHVIEITKACTVAFMEARNSLVFYFSEMKKTEGGEMCFLKLLLINFD